MADRCAHPDFTAGVEGRFVEGGTWVLDIGFAWRPGLSAKLRSRLVPEARLALCLGIAQEVRNAWAEDIQGVRVRLARAAARIGGFALPEAEIELVPARRG